MAKYVQRISLLGKERWIGWEIDGVGTEVPGLQLAEELSEPELLARGIKEFRPLPFEQFLSMGLSTGSTAGTGSAPQPAGALLDEDVAFRLDALQVALERLRRSGTREVSRPMMAAYFSGEALDDPRVRARLLEWEESGGIEIVGSEECFLRIAARLS